MSDETKRDDGGPAFPGIEGQDGHGNCTRHVQHDLSVAYVTHNHGMSLRDWFAGKAIQGLLANPNVVGFNPSNGWSLVNCTTAQIADYAKHIGDQMVLADGKGSQ